MGKTAIFGGSFNPVHNGHINLVGEMINELHPDRVIIVPTGISPFKQGIKPMFSGEDRLEMCRLAFDRFPECLVSSYEVDNEGVSYTVLTLRHFREMYPDDELFFIVGSDMLLSLKRWYRFEEIMQLATIAAASREDGDFDTLRKTADELSQFGRVILIKITPFPLSSTEIREKIENKQDFSCYLPEKVVKYILDKKV
ncbi:MAG: nicotinate (nicotinamide) nucleotide adenylyltransferase [Oscillospiraceae bacterium]|nr:nicotinate (nicotinamide) nucleotide adenylyltransferase [Oscillospiraceae bacterium]